MNFQAPASISFLFGGQWELPVGHQMVQPQGSPPFCSPGETVRSSLRGGESHPPAVHLPSSTGRATGAGNGPSLASGHTAVKLPAMKTAALKEKYKVPFETKHTRSSSKGGSRRVTDLHEFNAQLFQLRLRQELSEPWQCPDRFLPGLLYILQTAFCCLPVGTKGFATQFQAFLFRGLD